MTLRLSLAAVLPLLSSGCSSPPPPATKQVTEVKPKHAKVVQLAAEKNQVANGEALTLCYGVEDAVTVRLNPPVEELGLSRSRCISVSPTRNTTYELIAKGEDGEEVRETFAVRVTAAAPGSKTLIRSFDVMTGRPGQPLQLCYQTQGATLLRIAPAIQSVQPSETPRCFPINISAKTTFLLTATDSAGAVDRMQVTAIP